MSFESELEDFASQLNTSNFEMSLNVSNMSAQIPIDMVFNDGHILAICGYSILFVLSAIGNPQSFTPTKIIQTMAKLFCLLALSLTLANGEIAERGLFDLASNLSVLIIILKSRCRGGSIYSRIDFMLLHLAIADLMVTFLMMPLEVAWAITVSWHGGDLLCRIMAFFRIFGLYLSSFVLVCLALDRYLAVKYPLQLLGCLNRGKKMIIFAWCFSFLCSLPQVFIFHEGRHPVFQWYTQCVSFGSFATPEHELMYNIFVMLMMYALPLLCIVLLYCGIVVELFRRTRDSITSSTHPNDGLRRSGLGNLGRAKIKTLKMTVVIVVIFFVCWTPYYVMCLWYWLDKESALVVDQKIQKALFIFACTNSTANPIVYGIFHLKQVLKTGPVTRRRLLAHTHSFERTSSVSHRSSINHNNAVCLINMNRISGKRNEMGRHNFYVQTCAKPITNSSD